LPIPWVQLFLSAVGKGEGKAYNMSTTFPPDIHPKGLIPIEDKLGCDNCHFLIEDESRCYCPLFSAGGFECRTFFENKGYYFGEKDFKVTYKPPIKTLLKELKNDK
jgi:hypothetical protein